MQKLCVDSDTEDFSSDQLGDTLEGELLDELLQGEFCYVQTSDGKIVSVHYGTTANEEAINIKKGIASTFQANFDSDKSDVEEADPGSVHTSHYRYILAYTGLIVCALYHGAFCHRGFFRLSHAYNTLLTIHSTRVLPFKLTL